MKELLGLLLGLVLFTSCESAQYKTYHSDKIYLRQLVKNTTTSTYTSGSFFLIAGSVNSGTETETVIKVIGNVDGEYRFMQFNFTKVRIKIDNKVTTPYIVLNYRDIDPMTIDEMLYYEYNVKSVTIVCAEQYLPERLLPIQI